MQTIYFNKQTISKTLKDKRHSMAKLTKNGLLLRITWTKYFKQIFAC